MTRKRSVAILYPGNYEARQDATAGNNRFTELFKALTALGLRVEAAVYHDDFCEEVRRQLLQVDGVLVWVNPIEGGRDRTVLDALLRDTAAAGVFVSTHPDIILKVGTKEVLYRTRHLSWGCDTKLYRTMDQMRQELPLQLAGRKARVLKQLRGNSGIGVWKVQLATDIPEVVRVRHAERGCSEEQITLEEFFARCEQYFAATGRMIDQEYQERLPEGMIRCYLVHDRVVGFGHQAINALFPAPQGASPTDAPQPGPRIYFPPVKPEFQALKQQLEQEWVPGLQQILDIKTESLPILWDCDFLLGPKGDDGRDTYVLCEINVSSVYPYPESAVAHIAAATAARVRAAEKLT